MLFGFMAMCPPDYEGAAAFRAAMDTPCREDRTYGYSLKEIASCCGVRESLIHKWRAVGNIPEAHIDEMPEDVRRIYAEQQARRRGALVLDRDLVQDVMAFLWSLRPVVKQATLGPAECGPLSRSLERRRA